MELRLPWLLLAAAMCLAAAVMLLAAELLQAAALRQCWPRPVSCWVLRKWYGAGGLPGAELPATASLQVPRGGMGGVGSS